MPFKTCTQTSSLCLCVRVCGRHGCWHGCPVGLTRYKGRRSSAPAPHALLLDMASKTVRVPCQGHRHRHRPCKSGQISVSVSHFMLCLLTFEMPPVGFAGAIPCGSASYKPRPTRKRSKSKRSKNQTKRLACYDRVHSFSHICCRLFPIPFPHNQSQRLASHPTRPTLTLYSIPLPFTSCPHIKIKSTSKCHHAFFI